MAVNTFCCPNCFYDAPLYMFANVEHNMLRCRRCRSKFEDPNAFGAETTYADCDFNRVVTRYPFALDGRNAIIRVRPGYRALVQGHDGTTMWLSAEKYHITHITSGFQLYYVCLNPRISWGVKDVEDFGAYGVAHLSISPERVEAFCSEDGRIQMFETHLRELVVERLTAHVQRFADAHNTALLKHADGFMSALGLLEEGVSLVKLEPRGYRDSGGATGVYPTHSGQDASYEREEEREISVPRPLDGVKMPTKAYTVKNGVEEVFISGNGKTERHKAGELIELSALKGVEKLMRFSSKEFEFAHGWGLYNQLCGAYGYYSAQGTVSFYIDSTERMALLAAKTASWDDFVEQFFNNVLKKEVASALKTLMDACAAQADFDPEQISGRLSAMSVDLTNLLNGETERSNKPVFRQYGLRVNSIDILGAHFYKTRR